MAHNHDHHSNCSCRTGGSMEPQDAAGKSLTAAMRTSFMILKIIMIILVVLFLTSGIYKVRPDEQALVLVFGQIQGLGDERIQKPGLGFTWWPEPISEIIRIPVTKVQTLRVDSFWYFETEQEKLGQKNPYPPATLDPIKDGYCLTRNESLTGMEGTDYNIVHSRWSITYSIDNPASFFENIYYEQPKPGEDFLDASAKSVNPLMESIASDAIVRTMAQYSIDDAVTSKTDISTSVKKMMQDKLDAIRSGIKIDSARAERIIWPRQVDSAFEESIQASQQSKTAVTDAQGYKENLLTDTAGPDAEKQLEQLKKTDTTQQAKEEIVGFMKGQVQGRISEARAYKTRVVAETKANAEYLQKLLPEYKKHPALVLQRLYQETIEQVMASAEEKIMIQPQAGEKGREIRIQLSRDMKAQKKPVQNSRP
jgi:membrane protease subunit HflK